MTGLQWSRPLTDVAWKARGPSGYRYEFEYVPEWEDTSLMGVLMSGPYECRKIGGPENLPDIEDAWSADSIQEAKASCERVERLELERLMATSPDFEPGCTVGPYHDWRRVMTTDFGDVQATRIECQKCECVKIVMSPPAGQAGSPSVAYCEEFE